MGQQFTVKSMLRGLDGKLGEDDYIEPLEILIDSINKHNKFNIFGKVAFNHQLKNRLKMRKMLNELHENNNFDQPADPVFVIGLPRSGTSLLFNLLSLDIAHRFVYMCMADVPEYVEYLKSTSFDSVFKWHKKFYQALELNGKPTRWLLKDPSHIGQIPQILKEYPNAKFIHIHRDPTESVASFCSLTKNVRLAFSKKIDTDGIGKTVIDFWNHNLRKGMEDRKSLSSDQIVDIQYSEFVKNPLDHIKNTYQQLNFDMNIQTENKIQKYLEQDKNILKPEHRYTLDEFGLNQNDIKGQFKEYMLNYDF